MEKNLSNGEIVICTSEDGKVTLDTKLENGTIQLNQKQMAKLFGVKTPACKSQLNNVDFRQSQNAV